MADTNITIPELGSLTTGQVSDLLLVTRGTTGYKMLVSDIAKTIIETYAGSSLAGSAQSVKSALDSLNSSMTTLNSGAVTWNSTNVNGDNARKNWWTWGRIVVMSIEFTPIAGKITNGNIICSNIPKPRYNGVFVLGGNHQQMMIDSTGTEATDGVLKWYFPTDTEITNRIDTTIVYLM